MLGIILLNKASEFSKISFNRIIDVFILHIGALSQKGKIT